MEPVLNRTSLSEQVAGYLWAYVERHGLQAGDELPSEIALASQLGVSRAVVREAFRALAATGFLQVASGKRPQVGRLSNRVLSQFFSQAMLTGQVTAIQVLELRKAVEVGAAELAAGHRTGDHVRELQRILGEMEQSLSRPEIYVEHDVRFHLAMARATGNLLFVVFIDALRGAIEASIRTGLQSRRSTKEFRRIQSLHEMITAAIVEGDGPRAALSMARHFDEAVHAIVAAAPGQVAKEAGHQSATEDARAGIRAGQAPGR